MRLALLGLCVGMVTPSANETICRGVSECLVAYVGVRGGSERTPNKNGRPFAVDRMTGDTLSLLDTRLCL